MKRLKLGFLSSHGGSNMQAVLDAIHDSTLNAEACVLISNHSQSLAIQRAKDYGFPSYHFSGVTIHLVDEEYDTGTAISQCSVPVLPTDSVESLSQRVLAKEHQLLVDTLVKISREEIRL